jgi:hypothetical protein
MKSVTASVAQQIGGDEPAMLAGKAIDVPCGHTEGAGGIEKPAALRSGASLPE